MKTTLTMHGCSTVAKSTAALLLAACGATLRVPDLAPQPAAAFESVAFSPPPARMEVVPRAPKAGAVWIDGEWSWDGSRWAWEPGRWVLPPNGARFARWAVKRNADGTLLFAPGSWRNAAGVEIPFPEPLAVGKASGGGVIDAEGQRENTAPNLSPTDVQER